MDTIHDRRDFLRRLAIATTGLTYSSTLAELSAMENDRPMIPIVDTHQHLWDLKNFRLSWLKPDTVLNRSFLPSDYREATEGLNVVKAIYMEVDLDPAQQAAEAEYVIDLCKRGESPTVAGVISGRPASDGFKSYITPFKGNRYIKGVRQVLHVTDTPPGYCLSDNFVRGIRLLGELGLSYDLCLRAGELTDGAKLIELCPDTRFILDHCGNPDVQAKDSAQWKRGMEAIAKHKRVVCKVSGIVVSAKPNQWTADDLAPFVNFTLETFGPDRVMFGGDWPVCTQTATYKQWVTALQTIVASRSEPDRRKLFHDNAVRFYGLG
jgi:predicted TIM-barrel fold metal-dependent hydrolase